MGSKWAHSTCSCTPNSPKLPLEKHIFDPFLIDLWAQNSTFSRHFLTWEWPKCFAMCSKRAHFTCFTTPNGLGSFLEKLILDPLLSQKQPIFKAFCDLGGAKMACNGQCKGANFTCLATPNGLGSFLAKHIFDPFFVSKQPIFKAFWYFRRAKTDHHGLKARPKHLLWHSMRSRVIFEKTHFFPHVGPC